MGGPSVVLWLRKGLRVHDNAPLAAALARARDLGGAAVVPVFCLDPHFVQSNTVGPIRWRFLLQSLRDLDRQLQGAGSRLRVLRGSPAETLPAACERWGARALFFEKDTEQFARHRDAQVTERLQALGVEVTALHGHTLYDVDGLLAHCGGRPPGTYQAFLALLRKIGPPAKPLPAAHLASLAALAPPPPEGEAQAIPTLEDLLGEEAAKRLGPEVFPGGEAEGLRRLAEYCADPEVVCAFAKPDGNPTTILPFTTGLSPYLKFGCVSARTFYWAVQAVYDAHPKHTEPPTSLHGQLFFREWFYLMSYTTPNWERMEGNPLCRQIPWDRDPAVVAAWREGRTGYPWIDAVMQQLQQIGWMHHLARHCVACFLTRGDLWQHWEEGAKVFEYYLIDADWAINVANWYWLSASAFFSQYFRIYSPITFGQKYDKQGRFVRHYLPVLKDMPAKYIYEPWKAPLAVQRQAKCIVGVDYPAPIVDHAEARATNLMRMRAAYEGIRGSPGAVALAQTPPESKDEAVDPTKPAARPPKKARDAPPPPPPGDPKGTASGRPRSGRVQHFKK